MKKIIIAFAAVVAALSLASCNKAQIETPSEGLKLNITVGDLNGAGDTKAIKQGWESGDKLNIWFDQTNNTNPDLILTYDGTNWNAGTLGKTPNTSGNLIVLYEGYNDWSKYSHGGSYLYPTEYVSIPTNVYAQPIAYTGRRVNSFPYTYESNTLTANLSDWKALTKIQIVVKGIPAANASNYALKEPKMTNGVAYLGSASIDYSNSMAGGYALGVSNAEGVAFYFFAHSNGTDVANWTFTLKDIAADTEKTYSVSGKIDTSLSSSMVVGVKMDVSSFN